MGDPVERQRRAQTVLFGPVRAGRAGVAFGLRGPGARWRVVRSDAARIPMSTGGAGAL
jgi:hypothetical protein